MALVNAISSWTIQDFDGEKFAFPIYTRVSDADTLSAILTDQVGLATLVDAIADGKTVKGRLTVEIDLTGATIKGAPVSGSETERTGLFTFPITGIPGKSWSIDVPAFAYSKFLGNSIDLTDSDVTAFLTYIGATGTTVAYDNRWSATLAAVRFAVKSFRKHRGQTKRT